MSSEVSRAGLSAAEAAVRLKRDGYNELPRQRRRTPLRIMLEVLLEPMMALLLAGGVIYLIFGDLQEALILMVFASFSVVITVVQESRTERVLESLRDLTSPRALVIRDGERVRIAGREVVAGDLMVIGEGDRVPADARLVECADLALDESLLTGESVPVRKTALPDSATPDDCRPGGEDLPLVFAGSLVVRGSGLAEVTAIGARSEIGKIGQSLATLKTEPPRLARETSRLVRVFALFGGGVTVLAVLLYGFLRGDWLAAMLGGIALGMSMLPEEFPVVLTVFMAMGAWRISKARVLTRRAAAIETLGSATVLCTDKTGTLTQNRMAIAEIRLSDGTAWSEAEGAPDTPFHETLAFGILASAAEPTDPMEKAFHALGDGGPRSEEFHPSQWSLQQAYGLRPDLLAMSQLWQATDDASRYLVAAKGAPEAIAVLCGLTEEACSTLLQTVNDMAAEGLRVLGVARGTFDGGAPPDSQQGFAFELVGLVGLADPLRKSVPAAVAECRTAGIRVVMITGDYPATARAIARQAGIAADDVVSGDELTALSDEELRTRVRTATVFARIMPEQKLRIVEALKADGEIVAMTGDGVNDAPSLKAAHIGIAMGGRGTDVAREASAMVLLDDDFGSIVKAVRLGRRIYDNLRKAMGFIFAVHVPIAGLALLPLLFGLPILFGPVHIAFLEMIIDPVCSLVFEAEGEEDDVMRRPPRPPTQPLFSGPLVTWGLLQGAAVLVFVAAVYMAAVWQTLPDAEIRALTFCALVLAIVGLVFVNRSFSASLITAFARPNRALGWVMPAVVAGLGAVLFWGPARDLFRFGGIELLPLGLVLAGAALLLGGLEALKPLSRRRLGAT